MVVEGVAVVIAAFGFNKPVVGVQEYVCPATAVVPICAPVGSWFWLQLIVLSAPALATGYVRFTFTTTASCA